MLDKFSYAIRKARQMAKRSRAAVACPRCKSTKQRCSDYRPCKQCASVKADCSASASKTQNRMNGNTSPSSENRSQAYCANLSSSNTSNDFVCAINVLSHLPLTSWHVDSFSPYSETTEQQLDRISGNFMARQINGNHPTTFFSNNYPSNTVFRLPQAVNTLLSCPGTPGQRLPLPQSVLGLTSPFASNVSTFPCAPVHRI